jgi:hypothetical protein
VAHDLPLALLVSEPIADLDLHRLTSRRSRRLRLFVNGGVPDRVVHLQPTMHGGFTSRATIRSQGCESGRLSPGRPLPIAYPPCRRLLAESTRRGNGRAVCLFRRPAGRATRGTVRRALLRGGPPAPIYSLFGMSSHTTMERQSDGTCGPDASLGEHRHVSLAWSLT